MEAEISIFNFKNEIIRAIQLDLNAYYVNQTGAREDGQFKPIVRQLILL